MKFRTFNTPLRDNTTGFTPKYDLNDVGLNQSDFYFFGSIDAYGINIPPKKTLIDGINSADADEVSYRHIVTPSEDPEYVYTRYITSIHDIPSDTILKLVSLPGVSEIDTTLWHLSHILKSAIRKGDPTDDILLAIGSV